MYSLAVLACLVELFDRDSKRILVSSDGASSALDAAKSLQETARLCIDNDVHDPRRLRDLQPLESRALQARLASKAIPAPEREKHQGAQAI